MSEIRAADRGERDRPRPRAQPAGRPRGGSALAARRARSPRACAGSRAQRVTRVARAQRDRERRAPRARAEDRDASRRRPAATAPDLRRCARSPLAPSAWRTRSPAVWPRLDELEHDACLRLEGERRARPRGAARTSATGAVTSTMRRVAERLVLDPGQAAERVAHLHPGAVGRRSPRADSCGSATKSFVALTEGAS